MLLEGLQLGRYQLRKLVGRGAMGVVYLADDQRLPRQVAIKIVQNEDASNEAIAEATRLFEREARTIATLNHPHILPLFDFGEETLNGAKLAFLVTPFCPEGSLTTWLQQYTTTTHLPLSTVISLLQQAASALAYAHERKIVHRDVKPSNFLVWSRNDSERLCDILLADFGVARLANATVHASKTIRGTPIYMAPEQWSGDAVAASDQYALAIMTYELLTRKLPFMGTQNQVMYQHLFTYPQPPSNHNPQLSSAFDAVILRALAKQPEARFGSVIEFSQALQQAEKETQAITPNQSVPPSNGVIPVIVTSSVQPTVVADIPQSHSDSAITVNAQVDMSPAIHTASLHPFTKAMPHLRGRSLLLLAVICLLIISGVVGLFSFNNSRNTQSVNATATANNQAIVQIQQTETNATAQANQQATSAVQLAATATVTSNPYYDKYPTLVRNNTLVNGDRDTWDANSSCTFSADGYHVISTSATPKMCIDQNTNYSELTYSVQMTMLKGNGGGLLLHTSSSAIYYYRITQDRHFSLALCSNTLMPCNQTLVSDYSSWINLDTKQPNTLAIIILGKDVYLYINFHYVGKLAGNYTIQSPLGVAVEGNSEVVFNTVKVWIQ